MTVSSVARTKVLQLIPECHDRSHERSDLAEQIAAAFPRERYEVTSAFLSGHPTEGHPRSAAEHVHYFGFSHTVGWRERIALKLALFRYCREHSFDVVISHRYKPVSYMLQLHRLLSFRLCVGISHGFGDYRKWQRRLQVSLFADHRWRFVGVSDAVKGHLLRLGGGFTAANTVAIPNAVDVNYLVATHLPRDEARAVLGLPADRVVIGAIGRLVDWKGHLCLIQAFAQIAERFPDADLALIGEGPERARLEREIADCGLEGRVHLLGWQDRAARYVRAFDIWTMPSLREPFGLALLEGMSAGLPVIATAVHAMRDIALGAGGIAVPPADSSALAAALAEYLSLDALQRGAVGQRVFDYLMTHHRVEDYQRAYLTLIEEGLA